MKLHLIAAAVAGVLISTILPIKVDCFTIIHSLHSRRIKIKTNTIHKRMSKEKLSTHLNSKEGIDSSSIPPPLSWDKFTVEYEKRVEPFTSQFAKEMLRPILTALENEDNVSSKHIYKLLDVGCGTGTVTLQACSGGLQVTATDISTTMVERTKERASRCASDLFDNAIVSDGQSLPDEFSKKYDFVVSNFSVIFFSDPVTKESRTLDGLKEMFRCLTTKGRVSFTAWGSIEETPAFRIFPDVAIEICPELVSTGKPRRITGSVETLTKIMEEAGYVNIEIVGPITKNIVVNSPEEYYNRFALTSPPTAEMISKMNNETQIKFRNRVMELAKKRSRIFSSTSDKSSIDDELLINGSRRNSTIALPSSAYIAYGTKP